MQHWINGQAGQGIGLDNRGLAYGDGLFETLAVRDQQALMWPQHRARLQSGLSVLGIDCDLSALEREVQCALAAAQGDSVLKLMVVRDSEGLRGFAPAPQAKALRIVQLSPWAGAKQDLIAPVQPIRIKDCHTPLVTHPQLRGLKTLNALQYVLAAAELGDYAEGIMCDLEGYVVEGTKSNLFWLDNQGQIFTPSLEHGGVAGIVRQVIIQRAAEEGQTVQVVRAKPGALQKAEEIFVTNSLLGVQSVHDYRGRQLSQFEGATHIRKLLRGDIF